MQQQPSGPAPETADDRDALEITDRRTGQRYRLEISDATIRALDLRQIKADPGEFGMMAYDPGFANTAACRSGVTFIDGERGILNYRGYPIEDLARHASYLEVVWLLLEGELPTRARLDEFRREVAAAGVPPDWVPGLFEAMPATAPPMSMLMSGLAALGAEFPDALQVRDAAARRRQILRLLGLAPVLAGMAFRRREGRPPVAPDPGLSYAGNLLRLLRAEPGEEYRPDPVLERALDVLLVLHADHEQNCSTSSVRSVASSRADPYSAVAAGVGALYGPLHGGANKAVVEMLGRIGSVDRVEDFVASCKDGRQRLMGFGHRVYKSYDPRARIIKEMADQVFEVTGRNPQLDIALKLEEIALRDEYFVQRKLYPNVDFYSGLIYSAMGFDAGMFPVFFALGRMGGWLTHWNELMEDPEGRIARPRQIYTGPARRDFVPLDQRG